MVYFLKVAKRVVSEGMTVRQLEELVQSLNDEAPKEDKEKDKKEKAKKPPHYLAIEQEMQDYFGTATTINQRGERGKIEIEFLSESDLIRILDLLNIHL